MAMIYSPLSRQISSSFFSFPWRTARNWPSRRGRKTVYMVGESSVSPSVVSLLSTSRNCVSRGISFPHVPILWVIHHSLKRKQHMNRRPLLQSSNSKKKYLKNVFLVHTNWMTTSSQNRLNYSTLTRADVMDSIAYEVKTCSDTVI